MRVSRMAMPVGLKRKKEKEEGTKEEGHGGADPPETNESIIMNNYNNG